MTLDWVHFTPGSALLGGALIGGAAGLFMLCNGRIAGISGLLGGFLSKTSEGRAEKGSFLLGLLMTPILWSLVTPLPSVQIEAHGITLILAGLLVGLGTRYASGCTSGHGVCGLARLSPRSLAATLCFMGTGFATVYGLRHLWGG